MVLWCARPGTSADVLYPFLHTLQEYLFPNVPAEDVRDAGMSAFNEHMEAVIELAAVTLRVFLELQNGNVCGEVLSLLKDTLETRGSVSMDARRQTLDIVMSKQLPELVAGAIRDRLWTQVVNCNKCAAVMFYTQCFG